MVLIEVVAVVSLVSLVSFVAGYVLSGLVAAIDAGQAESRADARRGLACE